MPRLYYTSDGDVDTSILDPVTGKTYCGQPLPYFDTGVVCEHYALEGFFLCSECYAAYLKQREQKVRHLLSSDVLYVTGLYIVSAGDNSVGIGDDKIRVSYIPYWHVAKDTCFEDIKYMAESLLPDISFVAIWIAQEDAIKTSSTGKVTCVMLDELERFLQE